jgi:hypothetical protein
MKDILPYAVNPDSDFSRAIGDIANRIHEYKFQLPVFT